MIFIFNTKLQKNNRLLTALNQIFGLSNNSTSRIKKEFGLTTKMLVKNLQKRLKKQIIIFVEKNYTYGQTLKFENLQANIAIRNLRNYRGMRKRLNLPQRGQRTHTNARTIRKVNK